MHNLAKELIALLLVTFNVREMKTLYWNVHILLDLAVVITKMLESSVLRNVRTLVI